MQRALGWTAFTDRLGRYDQPSGVVGGAERDQRLPEVLDGAATMRTAGRPLSDDTPQSDLLTSPRLGRNNWE